MFEFLLALLTAGTIGVLLVPLLRTRLAVTSRFDNDLALYRDQLAEVEAERAAGSLGEADAAAARTEIERRILAAAEKDVPPPPRPDATLHRLLPPVLCLLIPALALGLYLKIGQPGLPSAPFVPHPGRPAAAPQQGPTLAQEIARLRERLKQAPDDPETLSALGELLTQEADGIVPQPAVDAFTKVLAKQPGDARAQFYLGLHESQAGESKAALKRWLDLEAQSPADAPWLPMLRAEIDRVAKQAGIDPLTIRPDRKPAPPPPAAPSASSSGGASGMPQPTPEQREAMAKMSPAERQQAIRGMVDQLEAKMADTPNDRPEARDGWLRLANARRVLGDAAKASAAYAKADALQPLDPRLLADWAETEVRQIQPGAAPSPEAVQVLERLEKADPGNALALFYLGAADFAKGNKAEAARRWKVLLGRLPADAPIRQMLEAKIKEAE